MPDASTAAPREGQSFVEPVTGMAFVWIPAGQFLMGSSKQRGQPNYDPEAYDDELPAHPVQLTGFWMSVYPVTNEQYTRFVSETGRAAPEAFAGRRINDPAQPVVTVSWYDARAFTAWRSTSWWARGRICSSSPPCTAPSGTAGIGAAAARQPGLRVRRYFLSRFDTGALEPPPNLAAADHHRTLWTIAILDLHRTGACRACLAMAKSAFKSIERWSSDSDRTDLSYRFLIFL
jgi:hypothetical protein